MDLRDRVAGVVRRGWLLVVACAAVGVLAGASIGWSARPTYAASVVLVLTDAGGAPSQEQVRSYAGLVATDRVAAAALDRLGLAMSPHTLRARTVARAVPGTLLLRVTVRDPSAARARDLADAMGGAFRDAASDTFDTTNSPAAASVRVWERAQTPRAPVSPRPGSDALLGLLAGLLAGPVGVVLRRRLGSTVSTAQEAALITHRPALGSIVHEPDAARRPLIVHSSPRSPRAEAFRQLRANLRYADVDRGPRSIAVTSAASGEGRTTTCCNLAVLVARDGLRVCLVEGDLRASAFGHYLGVDTATGLTSVLIGAAALEDAARPWGQEWSGAGEVHVLPAGPVPPNPSELLGSRGMADLLVQLTERYDVVLVDTPPLLSATDAAALARATDGALLLTRAGRARHRQVRRALAALDAAGARVLGTVVTMVPSDGPRQAGRVRPARFARPGLLFRLGGHAGPAEPAAAPARGADAPVALRAAAEQQGAPSGVASKALSR